MSPSVPTTAEIMRRLDEVVLRLDRMASALEEGYVRKDVQEAREAANTRMLMGLEDEQHMQSKRMDKINESIVDNEIRRDEAAANTRRLVYISILTAFVLPLVAALILHTLQAR